MPEEAGLAHEQEGLTQDQAAEAFLKLEHPIRKKAEPAKEPREEKREPRKEAKEAALEGDDQPEEESEPGESENEEPESEEEEEEAEEDDPESEVTVKIDGKATRIKLGDLVKGSLRHQDYTRKTQQLAEEKKKFEGELNSARQEREWHRAAAERYQAAIESITPTQEPDWNAILQTHGTDAAFRAKIAWDQAAAQRRQIEADRQRMDQQAEAEQAQARETHLSQERERMLEAIPEWRDSTKAERERQQMITFAKEVGFDDNDINQVVDHRAVKLLRLAWIGHKVQEKQRTLRPAPEVETVRTARPASQPRSRDAMSEAVRSLKQSGDVEDAADVFGALLKQERRRNR